MILTVSPVIHYKLSIKNFQLKELSNNVERILGYSLEELYEPNWWEKHIHPADLEQVLRRNSKILKKKKIQHEYRIQKKNKEHIWVFNQLRVIESDGDEPSYILGIM